MKNLRLLLTVALLVGGISFAVAQTSPPRDGTIVEQLPCAVNPISTYEQYVESSKRKYAEELEAAKRAGQALQTPLAYMSKEEFGRENDASKIECRRIKYLSDGLKVVGFIWRPKDMGSKKLPLIIFNRGGNREFAKLTPGHGIQQFALEGFVVIASQYRGNDGGEGLEEFGGADVHDVLNLVPLAESLGYVDMKNIFMLGWSRGGMMAFLALKNNIAVNAVAVGGCPTNMVSESKKRPGSVANIFRPLIPGYDTHAEESLRERSSIFWSERINVPVLIMHGGADPRVAPSEALFLAQKLQEQGKTYELVVYAGDDHAISMNKTDSNRRIVEWFRKYMK